MSSTHPESNNLGHIYTELNEILNIPSPSISAMIFFPHGNLQSYRILYRNHDSGLDSGLDDLNDKISRSSYLSDA